MIDSPRKIIASLTQVSLPKSNILETSQENKQTTTKKMQSETESVGESDTSTVLSNIQGQRVFRWSKFVRNLYEMAISSENAKAVGFSTDGLCLEIRDTKLLSSDVLQKYFKHKNVSSFIRQLNNYGFKTIPIVMNSSVAHCFAHDCFRKDRIDLLEGVTRRTGVNNEANKAADQLNEMREKEQEIEQRMYQLKSLNDQLKRHNMELIEENKRLKSNWMATQDSVKAQMYDQNRRMYSASNNDTSYSSFQAENPSEAFALPAFPMLFPEDF